MTVSGFVWAPGVFFLLLSDDSLPSLKLFPHTLGLLRIVPSTLGRPSADLRVLSIATVSSLAPCPTNSSHLVLPDSSQAGHWALPGLSSRYHSLETLLMQEAGVMNSSISLLFSLPGISVVDCLMSSILKIFVLCSWKIFVLCICPSWETLNYNKFS